MLLISLLGSFVSSANDTESCFSVSCADFVFYRPAALASVFMFLRCICEIEVGANLAILSEEAVVARTLELRVGLPGDLRHRILFRVVIVTSERVGEIIYGSDLTVAHVIFEVLGKRTVFETAVILTERRSGLPAMMFAFPCLRIFDPPTGPKRTVGDVVSLSALGVPDVTPVAVVVLAVYYTGEGT